MKKSIYGLGIALMVSQSSFGALIGHWVLNDGFGTNALSAIHSPADDAALVGDTVFVPDAAAFDGDGDAIQTEVGGVTGTVARTVAAWIQIPADDTAYQSGIISWGNSWTPNGALGHRFTMKINNDSGALRAEIGGGFSVGTAMLNDGEWHHVAVTTAEGEDDMANVLFYVDGVLDAVTSFGNANPINTDADRITIGGSIPLDRVMDDNLAMNGLIADARVYNEALDQMAISALAANAPGTIPGNPVVVSIAGPVSGGTEMEISWIGEIGETYGVETNTALTDGEWGSIITNLYGTGNTTIITNTIGPNQTFYRVITE